METASIATDATPTAPFAGKARKAAFGVGALLGMALGFTGTYFGTVGIFLTPVTASFGWSRGEGSTVTALSMLGLMLGSSITGALIDRFDPRLIIGTSITLFAACLFALSLQTGGLFWYGATSFAVGLLGVATGPAGYLAVLPRGFNRRLGLAFGLVGAGSGVGAAIFPILMQTLITDLGWRAAYRILSGIALGGGMLALLLLSLGGLAAAGSRGPTEAPEPVAIAPGQSLREAARERIFWTLLAMVVLASACGLGTTIHVPPALADRGMDGASVARITSMVAVGIMVGRLATGVLLDIIFAPLVIAAVFLLAAVGITLVGLPLTANVSVVAAGALLFGMAVGSESGFVAIIIRRYFGLRAFGTIYGLLLTFHSLGGLVAPIMLGVAYDRFGSYKFGIIAVVCGFLVSAVLILSIGRYRFARAEDRSNR